MVKKGSVWQANSPGIAMKARTRSDVIVRMLLLGRNGAVLFKSVNQSRFVVINIKQFFGVFDRKRQKNHQKLAVLIK